jgi:uncharacterized membrane protein YbhN (UPF0104 family)
VRVLSRLTRVAANPWVRIGLLAIVLAFCGYGLYAVWPQVTAGLGRLHWYSVALSLGSALAGSACMMLAWRTILADLGSPLPVSAAARINFLAQLGKYVPGAVWAFAAQVELGHDYHVPRRRSFASVVVSLTVTVGSGLGLALATLPFASPGVARHYWWALAFIPAIAAALCPPVLGRVLDRVLALIRSQPLERRPTWAGLGRALLWNLAGWLLLGVQVWLLLSDLAGLRGSSLALAVGGYALAFSAGMLLIVLPSGIGAREIILIAALSSVVSRGDAVAVALVTRLVTTVSDLTWGAVGVALGRRSARGARSTPGAAGPAAVGEPAVSPRPAAGVAAPGQPADATSEP